MILSEQAVEIVKPSKSTLVAVHFLVVVILLLVINNMCIPVRWVIFRCMECGWMTFPCHE